MKRHVSTLLAPLAWALLSTLPAAGQTPVVNPRLVEFDPSADHATVGSDGQPLVQRYELRVFALGAAQPFATADLGKPAPEADGKIRVDFSALITPWPPDGSYEARVAAVGPTGLGLSAASNAFSLVTAAPACAYALAPEALSLASAAGSASIAVTTGSACAWTASSDASWLTPAVAGGAGPATLALVVAANTGPAARTATLTVGGQAMSVTQAAAAVCSYTLSPTSISASGYSQTVSVGVAAGPGCAWTATASSDWITLAVASGTSDGTIAASLSRNSTKATRTGTITVNGRTCTITQTVPASPSQPKKPRVK